jgi:hypothetical protein
MPTFRRTAWAQSQADRAAGHGRWKSPDDEQKTFGKEGGSISYD